MESGQDVRLQRIVNALKGERPEKIILFGSRAYGNPRDNSDYDICVVKRIDASSDDEYNNEYYRLAKIVRDACPDTATDFVLYQPDDFEEERDISAFVAFDISRKGKVLYDGNITKG